MMSSAFVRSVAIRVTGACAALAISFLAASARAEVVAHKDGAVPAAAQAAGPLTLAVLDPSLAAASPTHGPASRAALEVLKEAGTSGYAAGPARPVFADSILVPPDFATTVSLVKQSGFTHLTGIVRSQVRQ
jgi:hypothetical protein